MLAVMNLKSSTKSASFFHCGSILAACNAYQRVGDAPQRLRKGALAQPSCQLSLKRRPSSNRQTHIHSFVCAVSMFVYAVYKAHLLFSTADSALLALSVCANISSTTLV